MPLILAIEPDKKQASQLTAMVRGRLHAELILGETAERALAALGHRVPDLILTSALLSPKDEGALGERLRALDGAAAHVQTLTTPVLAAPHGRGLTGGRASGMLSALRREKAAPATQAGCDPAMFAEQCREYLDRADAERQAIAEQQAEAAEHRAEAAEHEETLLADRLAAADTAEEVEPIEVAYGHDIFEAASVLAQAPVEAYTYAEPIATASDVAPVSDYDLSDVEPIEPVIEPAFEPAVASVVAAQPPDAQPELRTFFSFSHDGADGPASLLAAVAALAAEEESVEEVATLEPIAAAPAPVEETLLDDEAEAGYKFVDLDLSELLEDPEVTAARVRRRQQEEDDDESVAVYELDANTLAEFEAAVPKMLVEIDQEPDETWSETELYTPLPRFTALRWPMLAIGGDAPRPVIVVAEEPDEMKEWLDIIEALRRDAAMEPRPRVATPPPPEDPFEDAAGKKRRKRSLDSPAQDEWGFFDPEQCGFQALLAKLEEITEQDDRRTPRA